MLICLTRNRVAPVVKACAHCAWIAAPTLMAVDAGRVAVGHRVLVLSVVVKAHTTLLTGRAGLTSLRGLSTRHSAPTFRFKKSNICCGTVSVLPDAFSGLVSSDEDGRLHTR